MYIFTVKSKSFAGIQQKIVEAARTIGSIQTDDTEVVDDIINREIPTESQTTGLPQPVNIREGLPTPFRRDVAFPLPAAQFPVAAASKPTMHTGQVDSNGMPWDMRIHSETKNQTKKGEWKYRRNVEQNVIDQVEAEYKSAAGGAPSLSTVPVAPPVPFTIQQAVPGVPTHVQSVQPQPIHFPHVPAVPAVPMAAPVNAAPQPAAAPTLSAPSQMMPPPPVMMAAPPPMKRGFEAFKDNAIAISAALISEGKITMEWIEQLKAHFQVKEFYDIFANEQQSHELFNTFVQYELLPKDF